MEGAGGAAAELTVEGVEVERAGAAGVGCSAGPDDTSGATAELDTAVAAAALRRVYPGAADPEAAVAAEDLAASKAAVSAAFFSLN